jgi:hypothetical protein
MTNEIISSLLSIPWWIYMAGFIAVYGIRRATSGALTRRTVWPPGGSVSADTVPDGAGPFLVHQLQADLINRRLLGLAAQLMRLRPAVAAADERYERSAALVEVDERTLAATEPDALVDPEPAVSARTARVGWFLLATGDLLVVSQALTAVDSAISSMLAMLLAIAVVLGSVLLGKYLGHGLRSAGLSPLAVLAVGAGLCVAFTVGLMLLRLGNQWAWLILNLVPPIGAAVLVVLGPSGPQWRLDRVRRSLRRGERRIARKRRRLARLQGRALAMWARIDGTVSSGMLSVLAEARRTGTGTDAVSVDWHGLSRGTGFPAVIVEDVRPKIADTDANDRVGDDSWSDPAIVLWGDENGEPWPRDPVFDDSDRIEPESEGVAAPLAGPAYFVTPDRLNGDEPNRRYQ